MNFYPRSQIGIVLPNEDANNNVVKFTLRGIVTGVTIRTPSDEDLYTLPVYEITRSLFWDLSRKFQAENEMATQQGENISREQRVILYRG